MLLGRKLLKNVATRYDESRLRIGASTPSGSSSVRQRHVATASIVR